MICKLCLNKAALFFLRVVLEARKGFECLRKLIEPRMAELGGRKGRVC